MKNTTNTKTVSGWNKLCNYIENAMEYGSILHQFVIFSIPLFSLYGLLRMVGFIFTALM